MTGLVTAAVLIPAVLFGGTSSRGTASSGSAAACAAWAQPSGTTARSDGAAGTAYGTVPADAGACPFGWAPALHAVPGCPVTTAFGLAAGAQGRCVPARPK